MADVENNHERDKHETVPQNSSSTNRNKTDVAYLYFFGIIFVITVILNVYGSIAPTEVTQNDLIVKLYTLHERFKAYNINLYIYSFLPNAAAWIIAGLFYLILLLPFVWLLCWAPKILVYVAVIILYLYIIQPLLSLICSTFGSEELLKILGYDTYVFNKILLQILYLIILIPTAICVKKEGIKSIVDVIDESCRVVICVQSALSFILFILSYLMILIFEILLLVFIKSCIKPNLDEFLLYISLIGGLYILSFWYFFGSTVVAKTVADRYKNQNNEITLKTALWQNIHIVYRYHLGTIAFGATLILPFILAIYVACKHTIETSGNRTIARIFKLVLIGHITDFAFIQTAIYGHNFIEATRRSFNVMVKHYSISLVIIKIFEFIISIVVGLAFILSLLLIAGCGYPIVINVVAFNTIFIIVTLPILMIIGSATNTTLLCILEKRENEKSVQMNTLIHTAQNENTV